MIELIVLIAAAAIAALIIYLVKNGDIGIRTIEEDEVQPEPESSKTQQQIEELRARIRVTTDLKKKRVLKERLRNLKGE